MKKNRSIILTAIMLLVFAAAAHASGGEAHHADSGVLLKDFLYRCLNFGLTFGLLAYFLTKPIRKGMAGRREGIEAALKEACEAKEKAEAKFAEYDEKLAKATEEIEQIYEEIRNEGEREREKILANAREMAQKIKEDAVKAADSEVERACSELRQESARLAVQIAGDILKKTFTADDQSRLVNEYMQKVGELH